MPATLTKVATTGDTATYTRIRDPRRLLAARSAWLIAAGLLTIPAVLSAPILYQRLLTVYYPGVFGPVDLATYGLSLEFFSAYHTALQTGIALAALAAGLFVFLRHSDDWMAMLCALVLVSLGVGITPEDLALPADPPILRWLPVLIITLSSSTNFVFLAIFPDGRFVPLWLRWLVPPLIVWEIVRSSVFVVGGHANATAGSLALLGLFAFWGVAAWGQLYRWRKVATPIQRQQTKWIVIGAVGTVLLLVISGVSELLLSSSGGDLVFGNLVVIPLTYYGAEGFGIMTVMFAILRYRLWDVDLIIHRSLVYGALTLGLLGILVGATLLLHPFVANSGVALAVSAVAAGVLVNPAHRQVRRLVDRHLYGFRFDLSELAAAQMPPPALNPGALTGRMLGDYRLLGVLGKGGMGEVYQGEGKGRSVAIKILPPELAQQVNFRRRFEREAQTLAAFDHPNIVRIYESGESDGIDYIVMELVQGAELSEIIRRRGAIPFAEIRPFLRDFAAALDYAHDHGLVHRDIKSSNIMVRLKPDYLTQEAVLMDFGIAKVQDARTAITGTGAIGTIDYRAPEQIMSAQTVDRRADVYALGIVLYEMLTGERPFKGSAGQVLFAHLQQPPPDPRLLNDDLPAHVAYAVMKAMAKKPEDRFQRVGEFVAALL